MFHAIKASILFLIVGCLFVDALPYTGVNVAGLEFGDSALPGTYGVNYIAPTTSVADYFIGKGVNIFRLPFRWERVQQGLNQALNSVELGRLDTYVNHATGAGAYVILDPHNYARYNGKVIGDTSQSSPVLASHFADFWGRLAQHYKNNPKVIFGLVNEPNGMSTELWLADANAAIAAIRAAGATNLILVPGNGWTGAHAWNQNYYGTPNANVMAGVVDSGNNFAFEVHQYFDSDSSGSSETCSGSGQIGVDRLSSFTSWARSHNYRAFLGEFAGGNNVNCQTTVINALNYLESNADVWIGFSWWAAGPWWGEYIYTLEPRSSAPIDRPQLAWLLPYLGDDGTGTGTGTGTGAGTGTGTGAPQPQPNLNVYQDAMVSPFQDWSWSTDYTLSYTATVKAGSRSIRWTPKNWEGLYFQSPSDGVFSSGAYTGVEFWIHGGTSGNQQIRLQLRSNKQPIGNAVAIASIPANQWSQRYFSFQSIGLADGTPLDGLTFQAWASNSQAQVFIDAVVFVDREARLGYETSSCQVLSSWLF